MASAGSRLASLPATASPSDEPMLIALLTSCTVSQPLDEVELRKTFECAPCPSCPEPKKDETVAIATASFFAGFVLGLTLFLVR